MDDDKRFTVSQVPIESITVPEDRYRSIQTDDSLRSMAVSINVLGQTEDIGVRMEDGKCVLIYGEARLSMFKELGKKSVRCKVWNVDAESALLIELMENVARGRHDPRKLLTYMIRVLQNKKYKNSELPALFGVDKSEISKLKTIAEMREDLQEYFLEAKVPVDVMYELRILENDDAKLNALRLIIGSQYSKDAAKHYIRHIIACLCDKCKTVARERDNFAPLALHGERWLCTECAPKEKEKKFLVAPLKDSPLQTSLAPEGSPSSVTIEVQCQNCNEPYQHDLTSRKVCDRCFGRFNFLQGMAIEEVGENYWQLDSKGLKAYMGKAK